VVPASGYSKEDPKLEQIEYTVIPSWYKQPSYLQSTAQLIAQELQQFALPDSVHIFFSAMAFPATLKKQVILTSKKLRDCANHADPESTHSHPGLGSRASGMAPALH